MTLSYTALLWLMVGVSFYAALTHLQIGVRRPIDHSHALFGLVSLCGAFVIVTNIELATSKTPREYLLAARHAAFMVPLLFALLPWFIYSYCGQVRRWPAATLSVGSLGILIGNLFLPYTMMLSASPQLGTQMTPWGEPIVRSITPPTEFVQCMWVLYLLTIAYIVYSAVCLYRRGPLRRAYSFIVGLTPFSLALAINLLIAFRVIHSIFVGVFGVLLLIISMSVSLSGEWRRGSKKMQVLLDNVPAVVYVKQLDGRYMFINRQFETLYRKASADVLGKTDAQLFDESRAARNRDAEQRALSKTQPTESEQTLRIDNHHGNAMPFHATDVRTYSALHFPLVDGRGAPYAICGIATDITERKAAADALQALAATLDRRVTRRTDQLANLNRELESFAYSVSHDLRAPLTTVNGFADLLAREYAPKLDQTAHRYLNRIREGALRMGTLIQDLLNLSRVTQQAVQRTKIDLIALARDSLNALHEGEPSRQIALLAPETITLSADARLIGIALDNLVGNAWKYTSKTIDARIEIGTLEQDEETVYYIKDNGAGFDARYAERLFRPFVRLHSEQEFPGTGVGLATVARIVNRHGGRIWAEGVPQQGATFFFTLPAGDEDSEEKIVEHGATV